MECERAGCGKKEHEASFLKYYAASPRRGVKMHCDECFVGHGEARCAQCHKIEQKTSFQLCAAWKLKKNHIGIRCDQCIQDNLVTEHLQNVRNLGVVMARSKV